MAWRIYEFEKEIEKFRTVLNDQPIAVLELDAYSKNTAKVSDRDIKNGFVDYADNGRKPMVREKKTAGALFLFGCRIRRTDTGPTPAYRTSILDANFLLDELFSLPGWTSSIHLILFSGKSRRSCQGNMPRFSNNRS
jgi:hypothetical protein